MNYYFQVNLGDILKQNCLNMLNPEMCALLRNFQENNCHCYVKNSFRQFTPKLYWTEGVRDISTNFKCDEFLFMTNKSMMQGTSKRVCLVHLPTLFKALSCCEAFLQGLETRMSFNLCWWTKKEDVDVDTDFEWIKSIGDMLKRRIRRHYVNTWHDSIFLETDFVRRLFRLHEDFVIVLDDRTFQHEQLGLNLCLKERVRRQPDLGTLTSFTSYEPYIHYDRFFCIRTFLQSLTGTLFL